MHNIDEALAQNAEETAFLCCAQFSWILARMNYLLCIKYVKQVVDSVKCTKFKI